MKYKPIIFFDDKFMMHKICIKGGIYLTKLKKCSAIFAFFMIFSSFLNVKAYGAAIKKVKLATGESHSIILNCNGDIWSWGSNNFGQLGNGTTLDNLNPKPVKNNFGSEKIVALSAGGYHNMALSSKGNLWGWGWNGYGQLGDYSHTNSSTPKKIYSIYNVIAVECGYSHTIALKEDGTVWAWGQNDLGQLGNSNIAESSYPIKISGLEDIVAISTNYKNNLALDEDGNIWFWGDNWGGQLGKSYSYSNTPRKLNLPKDSSGKTMTPKMISAGKYHSIALMSDGTVWTWGYNALNDSDNDSSTPTKVSGLSDVKSISAGTNHNLAVKKDGSLWAWGLNGVGELGNSDNSDSDVPIMIKDLSYLYNIEAGNSFSLAEDEFGRFYSWGLNDYGQLGDGTLENHFAPYLLNVTPVTGVSLDKSQIELKVDETYKLIASITPSNAANKDLIWSSSNSSVAKVDEKGNVTALSPGTAEITVKTVEGSFTATCTVNVPVPVSSISLSKSSVTLILNKTNFDTDTIHATIYPSNAANKEIIWSSSNTNVVTVDSKGTIRAKSTGKATITAKTKDGNHKDTVSVTVIAENIDKWREITREDEVSINKSWRINFNQYLSYSTINTSNIYIKDEYGSKKSINIYALDKNDNITSVNSSVSFKSIMIIPESPYVKGRTYYLYIDNAVQSKNGKTLFQGIKMKFKVED